MSLALTNENQFAVTISAKIDAKSPIDAVVTLIRDIGKAGADKFEVVDQQTGAPFIVDLALLDAMGLLATVENSAVEEPESDANKLAKEV